MKNLVAKLILAFAFINTIMPAYGFIILAPYANKIKIDKAQKKADENYDRFQNLKVKYLVSNQIAKKSDLPIICDMYYNRILDNSVLNSMTFVATSFSKISLNIAVLNQLRDMRNISKSDNSNKLDKKIIKTKQLIKNDLLWQSEFLKSLEGILVDKKPKQVINKYLEYLNQNKIKDLKLFNILSWNKKILFALQRSIYAGCHRYYEVKDHEL